MMLNLLRTGKLELEALEERWTPAALATVAPAPNALVALVDTAPRFFAGPVPAPVVPPAVSLAGQPAAAPVVLDQASIGFPGRIVLPGTGVVQRDANASGPLTQPPGLSLVVGGDQPQSSPATGGAVPD
jgi:hypothetical protein